MTIAIIMIIIKEGITWTSFGGFVLFGGGSLLFIFQEKWENWTDELRRNRIKNSNCVLKENSFYFPRGYYFGHGILKNRKELPFEICTEIRTNTFPITAITNENEVIFLRGLSETDIINLNKSNILNLTAPIDIWEHICEEFLDTEFDSETKLRTLELLNENGISNSEVNEIRKRLRLGMLIRTYASWEWQYYGQFDVLHELWPLTEKKYWWTMDIALRNKNKNELQQRI